MTMNRSISLIIDKNDQSLQLKNFVYLDTIQKAAMTSFIDGL